MAALDGAELLAQVGLDPPRRVDIDAQLVALALAVGEQARLLGQPHLHVGDAAAHDLGFGGLRRELALELADAGAEVLHRAALLGELLGGLLGRFLLARVAFLGVLHVLVEARDLILERVDLRLERDDLDALAVGGRGLLGEAAR